MTIKTPLFGTAGYDDMVQQVATNWTHPQRGFRDAPVVVLCEPPSIEAARQSLPMSMPLLKMWASMAKAAGFVESDFLLVGLCPPIPKALSSSDKKKWAYVSDYIEGARKIIEEVNPRLVVALGALPGRALYGKALSVKNFRGMFHPIKGMDIPFFQMQSANLVSIQPDNRPVMDADLSTLSRVKRAGWDRTVLDRVPSDYFWCDDLSDLLANPPTQMSVDTEATGLDPTAPDYRVITVQLTVKEGETRICRICPDYFPEWFAARGQTTETCAKLRSQLKALIENPAITKLLHNGGYDFKALRSVGIGMTAFWDTELMARFVNENFMTYGLDDMTRIYVPSMSGYADRFNATVDKSRMMDVPPEDVLNPLTGDVEQYGMRLYAGGDTDATFRLAKALSPMLAQDRTNLHVFNRVHRRALFAMKKTMETYGFTINEQALSDLQSELETWTETEENELIPMIPSAVRRKYLRDPKGFSLARDECLRDVLFGRYENGLWVKGEGFGLRPVAFTPGTENETDITKKVPSVSTKDHFPYFVADPVAGPFVIRLIELKKAQKVLTSFVRPFRQHIKPGDAGTLKILPSYNFRTNTKRTNSSEPNGQNFPKRGRFAKPFRKLLQAAPGKVLVASDLSQAELRIAAWMAQEKEMLRIYRADGDIHIATAALGMGITEEEFAALDRGTKKEKRQGAKAINFGFLYGMAAPSFVTYAKTTYGVDFKLREAEVIRERYFERYSGLLDWHKRMKGHAHEYGFVKSLHGLTRHLQAVYSTDRGIMSGAERNAVNSPVQNFGSDLGVIAFLRLSYQADPDLIRPVGFIHDQLIAEVDEGREAEGMGWLKWVMENPPLQEWFGITPPLPIRSDPEWGQNLGQATELGDDPEMQALVAPHVRKPDWWNDDEEQAWAAYASDATVPPHLLREVLFA